jgi:6-phosphogluconolactonase
MNFYQISRMAKASIVTLAMVLGLSSCSLDYVVGYVYMTAAKSSPGVIDQYSIDYQSGALTQIGSPINAGNDPVAVVPAPNGRFIYVVNKGDSTVEEFAVQTDGTLAAGKTYPTGGSPTALAIDPQGAYLYVASTYKAGATSGSGVVTIFPVNADNTLGTSTVQPVGLNPVGVSTSYYNHFVYVLERDSASTGTVLGFAQNTSTGALTPVPGTTITGAAGVSVATGYSAGVVPSAIAEEQTARFVYVTDEAANQLIGYSVQSNGSLVPMVNGPFATGLYPINLTIDPTGKLIYVLNYNANTVQGYAIDTATGTPSGAVGAYATATGAGPTCVTIDPSLGTNLYVSNSLDNTVTGEKLTPNTGALAADQNSPFVASGTPTCLTTVPNGAHSTQTFIP